MGLDQNAYKVSQDGEREELAYWRKHNRLQGWMEERYTNKGGVGEFNCVDLELDEDDILDLEVAIDDKELPETGGFFFGEAACDLAPRVDSAVYGWCGDQDSIENDA